MSHQKDTEYLSLSTRIHAMGNRLLNAERMERMIEAQDADEAAKVLSECGYGELPHVTAAALEDVLSAARVELFRDMTAAVPQPAIVRLFQLKYDYHNAKVLLKAEARGVDADRLLLKGGRYDPAQLAQDYRRDDLRGMETVFRTALTQGKETLAATADPQRADFLLDRFYYEELTQQAALADSPFLAGYVRLCIDSANLRSAVRAARLGKESDFLALAILPGGSRAEKTILTARGEDLVHIFQTSPLANAAELGVQCLRADGPPLTEFERECDDVVTAYLASARRTAFGPEVVIGYIYAREAEITAIRTILSGRMAGLDGDTIRGRLRATYL